MQRLIADFARRRPAGLAALLRRPELMAFLPALTLAAFWLGGEGALILVALGLPLTFVIAGAFGSPAGGAGSDDRPSAGLVTSTRLAAALDSALAAASRAGGQTACLVVQIDEADALLDRHGRAAQADILAHAGDRLSAR